MNESDEQSEIATNSNQPNQQQDQAVKQYKQLTRRFIKHNLTMSVIS